MPELSNAPSSPEINAEELARRFEEKKKLLENTGLKSEARDVFREAFREHVAPQISQSASVAGTIPVASPKPSSDISSGDKTELKDLVSLALEKGILEAIAKAQAETPYLIDALHDELADHYYDKLLALGKISADA